MRCQSTRCEGFLRILVALQPLKDVCAADMIIQILEVLDENYQPNASPLPAPFTPAPFTPEGYDVQQQQQPPPPQQQQEPPEEGRAPDGEQPPPTPQQQEQQQQQQPPEQQQQQQAGDAHDLELTGVSGREPPADGAASTGHAEAACGGRALRAEAEGDHVVAGSSAGGHDSRGLLLRFDRVMQACIQDVKQWTGFEGGGSTAGQGHGHMHTCLPASDACRA